MWNENCSPYRSTEKEMESRSQRLLVSLSILDPALFVLVLNVNFPVVSDGPNVGYFGHGTLHYSQIKLVVEKLEAMNETPLVVMPGKYTRPFFRSSRLDNQKLSERDQEVLNE